MHYGFTERFVKGDDVQTLTYSSRGNKVIHWFNRTKVIEVPFASKESAVNVLEGLANQLMCLGYNNVSSRVRE